MARKTVSVENVRKLVNQMLLHSPDDHEGNRKGAASVLESILHETGNYRGFGYLNVNDMKKSKYGKSLGINDVSSDSTINQKFDGTDDSRRYYY